MDQGVDERLRAFLERMRQGERTRIVAFGSSNTDARNRCRFNWVDWFDTGMKMTFGRVHHTINTGIGGDTTRGLLRRFDTDVALYQPHLVFVTIGGNDSSPNQEMGEEEFRDNLTEVGRRVQALEGAILVFQTYYGCDLEQMDPDHAKTFVRYMEVVREVGLDLNCVAVDHLVRWDRLREAHVEGFRALMNDPMHVKPTGNLVMGLDLLRAFGAGLNEDARLLCEEGYAVQRRLDGLEAGGGG